LIGVLPIAALIAALAVDAANAKWPVGRHVVNVFVGMCVMLTVIPGGILVAQNAGVIFGSESQSDYLSKSLDVYDAEAYVNDYLPERARIVLFDEVRGFYLDRDYIWGNPGHHEMIPWSSFKTGADMTTYFMNQGYTHVLINWRFAVSDDLHDKLIGRAIALGLMRQVYSSQNVNVYELSAK
jgi:hypothetical protein